MALPLWRLMARAVLRTPESARACGDAVEREQPLGRCLGDRQACDEIDRFATGLAADLACLRQSRNLRPAGPFEIRHDLSCGVDLRCFNPAVLFPRGFGVTQVRRRTVVDPVGIRGGMVMNEFDRFHLVGMVMDRVPALGAQAARVRKAILKKLIQHKAEIEEHGLDLPEMRNWQWGTRP